mmetsp:Transcript_23656/g.41915  ORF Transcript_23656/g.41915 Transcript_23656/m.41915 type:complete len:85 (+) Transcript_23656:1060-1314(+)
MIRFERKSEQTLQPQEAGRSVEIIECIKKLLESFDEEKRQLEIKVTQLELENKNLRDSLLAFQAAYPQEDIESSNRKRKHQPHN